MKLKTTTKWLKKSLALVLALITVAGSVPLLATTASADESYAPTPLPLTFRDDPSLDDFDGISVREVYENCYYDVDTDYLLDGFDASECFKNHSKCIVVLRYGSQRWISDAKASFCGNNIYTEWTDPGYYVNAQIGKEYTSAFTLPSIGMRITLDSGKPYCDFYSLGLSIYDATTDELVYSKTAQLKIAAWPSTSNLVIEDFNFPGTHAAAMDTEAWCNVGNVKIRYLEEDKQTERTKLTGGDKGYVEFTVIRGQNGRSLSSSATLSFGSSSSVANLSTASSDVTRSSNGDWVKFYHYYEIADDEKYICKQGRITVKVPEVGATPSSDINLVG